jgi:acyl-CoA dehydrogenase
MNVRAAVLTVDETQTSFLEQGPTLIERAARTAAAAAADADEVDRDARFPHKAFEVAR